MGRSGLLGPLYPTIKSSILAPAMALACARLCSEGLHTRPPAPSSPIHRVHLLLVFACLRYIKALSGDTPAMLGASIEELFRCATAGNACQAALLLAAGLPLSHCTAQW